MKVSGPTKGRATGLDGRRHGRAAAAFVGVQ